MSIASEWMQRVSTLGCAICHSLGYGHSPAEVHHILDTAHRDDFLTIPLCPEHHRGGTGFHGYGQRRFETVYKTDEIHLLAWTLRQIAKQQG